MRPLHYDPSRSLISILGSWGVERSAASEIMVGAPLSDILSLLGSVVDVMERVYRDGDHLLDLAVMFRHHALLEWSLRRPETDVNDGGVCGRRPLNHAARLGWVSCGQLLVDAGADVDVLDDEGFRPLHEAASEGHVQFLKNLIVWGADWSCAMEEHEREFYGEIAAIAHKSGTCFGRWHGREYALRAI